VALSAISVLGVEAWPEGDPVRRIVVRVYEAARTPLP
jgi:hypothetical protein